MRCILQLQVNLRSSGEDLDIAEVARRSGVPASTLRFYEKKGLIASTGRRGLRRVFDPRVLERLALSAAEARREVHEAGTLSTPW